MSHLKAKIKRPVFTKVMYEMLCISEFPFNSGGRISKGRRIMEVLRTGNSKYDRYFQLTDYLF